MDGKRKTLNNIAPIFSKKDEGHGFRLSVVHEDVSGVSGVQSFALGIETVLLSTQNTC